MASADTASCECRADSNMISKNVTHEPLISHDFKVDTLNTSANPNKSSPLALLVRFGLTPSKVACLSQWGQSDQSCTGLSECNTGTTSHTEVCVESIKTHSASYPQLHLRSCDVPGIRAHLNSMVWTPVIKVCISMPIAAASSACTATELAAVAASMSIPSDLLGDTAQAPPLVNCARHKAVAYHQELDSLEGRIEAAKLQLQANRDTLIASAQKVYDSQLEKLLIAGAATQVALQAKVAAADKALDASLEATSAATEVIVECIVCAVNMGMLLVIIPLSCRPHLYSAMRTPSHMRRSSRPNWNPPITLSQPSRH